MLFNARLLRDQLWAALFHAGGTDARLTRKRIRVLLGIAIFLPLIKLMTLIGMALDEVFFPGYRRQKIERPVFIVGNFRTGTTFLQRLMAQDRQFSVLETWEIYTAPTVSQRKLIRGVSMCDRLLGGPLHRILYRWESRSLGRVKMHPVGFHLPDEDEGILLHVWSGIFTWFLFPVQGVSLSYPHFDRDATPSEKRRLMRFYRGIIQRHLYAHGGKQRYLAKNPSASPRVETLRDWFPDAQFIYMARNPLEMVPSKLGWFSFCFHYMASPLTRYPFRDQLLEMMLYWYQYPLERLANDTNAVIVRCEDLVVQVAETIRRIYRELRITVTPAFNAILHDAELHASNYSKDHDNSLERCDLTPQEVADRFSAVMVRFGYSRP